MSIKNEKQEATEQKGETVAEKYFDAIEPKEIATKLIDAGNFNFPTNTPILYVFIDKAKKFWGKCQLVSGVHQFASGYQFMIQFNYAIWQTLNENQRGALVWHELEHVGFDSEKNKYYLIPHDVEEFSRVIRKYGLWREDVKRFMDEGLKAITLTEKQ